MMDLMELPKYVRDCGGRVWGVKVIGVLQDEIETPEHLSFVKDFAGGVLVGVDLVGLITEMGTPFRVKGRTIAVIRKSALYEAKRHPLGRLPVILQGVLAIPKASNQNIVQMVPYRKENNRWIVPYFTKTEVLNPNKYPEYNKIILDAYNAGWEFKHDVDRHNSYVEACEGLEFKYLTEEWKTRGGTLPRGGVANGEVSVTREVPPQANDIPPVDGYNESLLNSVPPYDSVPPIDDSLIPPEKGSDTPVGWGVPLDDTAVPTLGSGGVMDTRVDFNNPISSSTAKRGKKEIFDGRKELAKRSPVADLIEGILKESEAKVEQQIEYVTKLQAENMLDDDIAICADAIIANWSSKRVGVVTTGRALFKSVLEDLMPDFKIKNANNRSIIDTNLEIRKENLVRMWRDDDYPPDEESDKFLKEYSTLRTAIYIRVIEKLLGIRANRLVDVFTTAQEGNLYSVMKQNPYLLCILDSRFKVEDLDKLALLYGVNLEDEEVIKQRNVAYLHNVMLSSDRPIYDNTSVPYHILRRELNVGFVLNSSNYTSLINTGYIFTEDNLKDIATYLLPDLDVSNFALPKDGWRQMNTRTKKYVRSLGVDANSAIQDFIDSGLGVVYTINGTKYISDYSFAKKEMYIYNRLYELSQQGIREDIEPSDIEEFIKHFEENKAKELSIQDFKLEERQADAVRLLPHAPVMAMTGPAGSGKTMTADALVCASEELLGYSPDEIYFVAPTGKAANRLKELVKRRTRTINSEFGIGSESFSLKEEDILRRRKKTEIRLLIVDESSMINIDLMYNMMTKISDETRIIFLGDIEQLPPIGFGKPFANMLQFLPTVVLNVSKRASDKSGITSNAKEIIYNSDDPRNIKDLRDTDDFRIIHTEDEDDVVSYVLDVCMYHLGKGKTLEYQPVVNIQTLNPDDIQVISPLKIRNWGTARLNKLLQDIFNPKRVGMPLATYRVSKEELVEFRLHDRVYHKENQRERIRLKPASPGTKAPIFTLLFDELDWENPRNNGIMNGDVGKVVGFYTGKELDFSLSEHQKTLEDKFHANENTLFIGVEYKDMDSETGEPVEFILLYRCEIINKRGSEYDVVSQDLAKLEHAFALTTHKLQGSQAKLIIMLILQAGGRGFISRNMIYTSMTRGEKAGYLIGSVYGSNSVVNKGRQIEQTSMRKTVIDLF